MARSDAARRPRGQRPPRTKSSPPRITSDHSFVLAVAVIRERIGSLLEVERQDLFELMAPMLSRDPAEQASALQAANEILEGKSLRVQRSDLLECGNDEMKEWLGWFSNKLRTCRKSAGLTQDELAEKAGIPQPHISRLEAGKHSPSAKTVERLAKALGVPVSQLDPSADDAEKH